MFNIALVGWGVILLKPLVQRTCTDRLVGRPHSMVYFICSTLDVQPLKKTARSHKLFAVFLH